MEMRSLGILREAKGSSQNPTLRIVAEGKLRRDESFWCKTFVPAGGFKHGEIQVEPGRGALGRLFVCIVPRVVRVSRSPSAAGHAYAEHCRENCRRPETRGLFQSVLGCQAGKAVAGD